MMAATAAPVRFRTPAAFRAWLAKHHSTATHLVVHIAKAHVAHEGLTYAEALDEALCFGWIDGVRRSLGADGYSIRFSPRKPRSIWSRINVSHVTRLIREKRMQPAGLAAYRARDAKRTGIYSFEQKPVRLTPSFEKQLRANPRAWANFQLQPPCYRRTSSFWVMSAKREDTRARRLATLIACSAKGERIPLLRQTPAKSK